MKKLTIKRRNLVRTIAALFVGGVILSPGILSKANAASLTWDANGTGAGQTDGAGTWTTANQWWDGAANATWNSVTPDDATIGSGGAGGAITLGGNVTGGTINLNNFTGTYTLQGTAQTLTTNSGITIGATAGNVTIRGTAASPNGLTLAGTGGITMNSTGLLSLRENLTHSYTGATTINAGTVLLGGAKSTGNFNLAGGILTDYFGGAYTWSGGLGTGSNQIQITGNSGFGAGNGTSNYTIGTANSSLQWGSANFNPTTLKFFAPGVDNMGPSIFGVVQFNNGFDLNGGTRTIEVAAATGTDAINSSRAIVTGVISNSTGTGILSKTGGGNLQLNGANTYGGGTNITAGMVRFNGKTTMPNAGTVAVSTGATLGILVDNGASGWGGGTGNGGIAGLINSGLGGQSGGTVTFAGNSNLYLDVSANTTESNNLGNGTATNLSLIKYGAGILTLSGNNTFSGSVAVGAGSLVLSGTNTYTGGTNITAGTGQFRLLTSMPATGTVAVSASTLAVNIGGPGEWTTGTSGAGTIGGLIAASAVGGQGNTVTWSGASAVGLDTTNAPVPQDYTGNIINRGTSLGVTKLGSGTLTLSGTNTYTGATTINGGTLIANSNAAIATTGLVTLGNVAGATFQINSNKTIGNLSGGGTTGGTVALQGNTLTVGDGTAQTYGGIFTGTNASSIIKQGSGTLTLSNVTNIPGTATINAGTLLFSVGNLSGGTITLGADNAVLQFGSTSGINGISGRGGAVISNPIVLGSSVTSTGATIAAVGGNQKWNYAGSITGAAGATQTLKIDTQPGTGSDRATTTVSGVIANGSSGTLSLSLNITPQTSSSSTNNHPTFLNLSGLNTFTGNITATRGNAGATSWLTIGGERWVTGNFGENTPLYGREGNGRLGHDSAGVYAGNIIFSSTAGRIVNLDYFSSANQTWSGVIGASGGVNGALVKEGTGTLTLSNANLYNSLTTIGGGTLVLGFGNDGNGITNNILPAATPLNMGLGTIYDPIAANADIIISGGGGGGTLELGGSAASATQTVASLTTATNTASTILVGANRTLTITSGTVTTGANSALNFNTASGGNNGSSVGTSIVAFGAAPTFTSGYTVTDAGGFGLATVNGSNQVIRNTSTALLPASGAASATDYRIDNNAGGAGADGSSSLAVTASQTVNSITVDTTTASGTLTLNSGVVLSNNTWNFGGGSNTYNITGSAGSAGVRSAATGSTIAINNFNSGTVTFDSPILAFGTNAVNFNGTGTTVLNGLNTFSGAMTIGGGGTLQIGSTGRLVGGAYAGAIALGGGSTFRYSGTNNQTLSGAITGPGGITKDTNTSDLTLSSTTNSYTGITRVSVGRINVTAATNLSSGGTSIEQSGTGQIYVNGAGATLSNPFNISTIGYLENSDSQNNVNGAIRLDNTSGLSGTITLSGNSRIGKFGNTSSTISGQITGGFGIDFYGFQSAANQAPVFVLSNTSNNYTGTTTIYNSNYNTTNLANVSTTLRLGASNVIPDGANAGNVAFAINGTNNNATVIFDLNGFNETINGLTVNPGTFATRITNTAAAANSVLTVGANNTTSSFSGTITDSGVNRTLGLTKIGNSDLTLTGTNNYIGATTVSAGRLIINGNQSSATGTVTVGSAGTLAGDGTIGGAVVVNGKLAPGNSPDFQTYNAGITFNAGSTFETEILGATVGNGLTGYDSAVITAGNVVIDPSTILSLPTPGGSGYTLGSNLWIIDNDGAGTLTGNFASLLDGTQVTALDGLGGYNWKIFYGADQGTNALSGGNDVVLNAFEAIPEPSTLVLGSLALLGLAGAGLRRRRLAQQEVKI